LRLRQPTRLDYTARGLNRHTRTQGRTPGLQQIIEIFGQAAIQRRATSLDSISHILPEMAGLRGLWVLLLLAAVHVAVAQPIYPESGEYVPLRYELDLGGGVQIATVEGATAQALAIDRSQFSPGKSAKNVGYVQPSGTRFQLNGSPWYCAGTNAYYAALKWIMSDAEVAALMKVRSSSKIDLSVLLLLTRSLPPFFCRSTPTAGRLCCASSPLASSTRSLSP
jgi:hypothetical protein